MKDKTKYVGKHPLTDKWVELGSFVSEKQAWHFNPTFKEIKVKTI